MDWFSSVYRRTQGSSDLEVLSLCDWKNDYAIESEVLIEGQWHYEFGWNMLTSSKKEMSIILLRGQIYSPECR